MAIRPRIAGFTLLELMVVVVIVGIIAMIILPRVANSRNEAAEKACYHNRLLINSAIERYAGETGTYPTLQDLEVLDYFPEGIPKCPVNGHDYSLNGSTGRIDGHASGVHP